MTRGAAQLAAVAALAAWLWVPRPVAAQGERTKAMQEDLLKAIDLADEDYAKLDDDGLTALSLQLAETASKVAQRPTNAEEARQTPVAVAVWAPAKVVEKDWRQWPLIVGQHTNGWRGWSVRWETNARLVITDLDTGRVVSNRLGISDKKRYRTPPASRTGEEPDDFQAATVATGVDLYRIFEEKEPGEPAPHRFAVTVLDYDKKSNTVVAEVLKTPPPAAPAVEARVRETAGVVEVSGGGMEPGQMRATKARVDVSVALLPEQATPLARGEESGVTLLPAALLVVGLDVSDPLLIRLWTPAHALPGGAVKAAYSLDLGKILAGVPLTGEHQVYVATGGTVLGPVAVEF